MSIDEALLVRYLTQDTDEQANADIEQWKRDLPANAETLHVIAQIWEKTAEIAPVFPDFDTDKAWAKLSTVIENQPLQHVRTLSTHATKRTFIGIAASVILLFGISFWLWGRQGSNVAMVKFASGTTAKKITLPDGSILDLLPNSQICYPQKFTASRRAVQFEGEGTFDVTHNPQQVFEITTPQGGTVTVLGTRFSLKAPKIADIELHVTAGKVRLNMPTQALILTAGESAKYDTQTQKLVKNKYLDFNTTPLKDAIAKINKMYEARIKIGNAAIENCLLTVQFDNQSLDTILQIIAETLGLTLQKEGDTWLLNGKNCM